jgi:citrate synthase
MKVTPEMRAAVLRELADTYRNDIHNDKVHGENDRSHNEHFLRLLATDAESRANRLALVAARAKAGGK